MVTKKEINVTLLAPLTRNNKIKAKSRQDTTVISRISTPFTYSSVMAIKITISATKHTVVKKPFRPPKPSSIPSKRMTAAATQ